MTSSELTPQQRESLLKTLRAEYQDYRSHLENHLKHLGIAFEWRDHPSLDLKDLIGREETLFIVPGRQSPLNRLAGQLIEEFGVRLVYDPVSLRKYLGQAAYHPVQNVLYLDSDAGRARHLGALDGLTMAHEIVHVISDAYRSGRSRHGAHPLHIAVRDGLTQFHGDELIAHGLNIRLAAGILLRNSEGSDRSRANAELIASVKHSLKYAEGLLRVIGEVESKKLISRKTIGTNLEGNQTWAEIRIDQDSFLRLFVPPHEIASFEKAPVSYMKTRLERVKEMARFAIEQLGDQSARGSKEFLEKALFYRSRQDALMQGLLNEPR